MGTLRPVVEAENRLERFNEDRDRIVGEVQRRIVRRYLAAAKAGEEHSLEYVLNDVAYCELKRHGTPKSRGAHKAVARWRDLAHQLQRRGDRDRGERAARRPARTAAHHASRAERHDGRGERGSHPLEHREDRRRGAPPSRRSQRRRR